jgi:hypothetical protein
MSSETQPAASKRDATIAVGCLTIAWGIRYVYLGIQLINSGYESSIDKHFVSEGMAAFFELMRIRMIEFGIIFLLQGIFGFTAARGVLLGRQWGRILTFLVAILAIYWGWHRIDLHQSDLEFRGGHFQKEDIKLYAIGAFEILYGIFAFLALIIWRKEFSRSTN